MSVYVSTDILRPFNIAADPRRFLYSDSSLAPLNLTLPMLQRILTYHQVMPAYLDFISVFQAQLFERDVRFSGFQEQIGFSSRTSSPAMPNLGRSGLQYQLCYNLKMVKVLQPESHNPMPNRWPMRQAAFHHQFDVKYGTALWISTKVQLDDLKIRTKELTGKDGRLEDHDYTSTVACFKSTLPVHLMYCHLAAEGWRWYIRHLEDLVDHKVM